MSKFLNAFAAAARAIWRHISAAVALALIALALAAGYWLGSPGSQPEEGEEAATAATAGAEPQMYTCSMHPSVRLPDPDAKCPICFMDLIPVTAGAAGGDALRLTISAEAAALSRIETAPVARFFPRAEVRLFGKVTYDETSVARLTAYFPGRIERLFVNYVGVPVAQGDHLAEIYSPDLLAAFTELRQAQLAQEESEDMSELVRRTTGATLRAARDKLRLYGLTTEQIDAIAAGTYDSDRLTIYAPIGGVVTHLQAREGDYLDTGDPIATVANLSRLWLDLEAYESQLPLLRWGQPVSFTVEAHPGRRFQGRISFIEPIVDERTRTAAVRVAVDNTERQLKPGMFVSAVVRPRIGAGGVIISDELAGKWVSPMHPTIVKDEPGQCDICGMDLVPAESLGVVGAPETVEAPLVVPRTAVLFTGARSLVFVEEMGASPPAYDLREVMLGPRAGDFYIVREGLKEGEPVVVNGAFRLDSAMQIAGKPSMMMPGEVVPDADATEAGPPEQFIASLSPVYDAYLAAQEALAADDFEGFRAAATALDAAIERVDTAGVSGESLGLWRRAAAGLRPKPAADIETARAAFEGMSDAVIELHQRFGRIGGETLHIAYCPMAFDFKGADWVQRGEAINNPYFGASMLRCGEIREPLAPRGGASDASDEHEGHDHG
ncbi:MAG: efflux RND transporter periplasmic adaptor subunit [Phycisphaerales bacterium JB039]